MSGPEHARPVTHSASAPNPALQLLVLLVGAAAAGGFVLMLVRDRPEDTGARVAALVGAGVVVLGGWIVTSLWGLRAESGAAQPVLITGGRFLVLAMLAAGGVGLAERGTELSLVWVIPLAAAAAVAFTGAVSRRRPPPAPR